MLAPFRLPDSYAQLNRRPHAPDGTAGDNPLWAPGAEIRRPDPKPF